MSTAPSYQVYRLRRQPDLCCAVPENLPQPDFLGADEWEEAGKLTDESPAPPGFQHSTARYAVRVQGFYVFRWQGRRPRLHAASKPAHHSSR